MPFARCPVCRKKFDLDRTAGYCCGLSINDFQMDIEPSEEDTGITDLDLKKHELEVERLQLDRRQQQINSIGRVLEVVRYLDEVRYDRVTITKESFDETSHTIKGRELTPQENEIANDAHECLRRIVHQLAFQKAIDLK